MQQSGGAGSAGRRGNLPAELTSFVGRLRELDQLTASLSHARLVSLVGPGGVGKTRLALRAAGRVARAFPGGTGSSSSVRCATRPSSPNRSQQRSACATNPVAGSSPPCPIMSRIAVSSWFSIIASTCWMLAPFWRWRCSSRGPSFGFATTREPLGLTGESLVHVAPLDPDDAALQLLVDRATSVRPGFGLTDATLPIARELCRRLDGIACHRVGGGPLAGDAARGGRPPG